MLLLFTWYSLLRRGRYDCITMVQECQQIVDELCVGLSVSPTQPLWRWHGQLRERSIVVRLCWSPILDDAHRYDVIVALDESVRQDLLTVAATENAGDVAWYSDRICGVSTFSHYCGDEIMAGARIIWM